MSTSLYDRDFQLWIEQTIRQLQDREFESIDIEHLVEELADLGKAEKNALRSNLTVLLANLLKLTVQLDAPETIRESWCSLVIEQRGRILISLEDTPSLREFLPEALLMAYLEGWKMAIRASKFAWLGMRIPDEEEYPAVCPFSIEQILDEEFYS